MPKVHTIRIEYSNGTKGVYVGRCPYDETEADELTITGIEIGPTEDVEEEIINKIRKGEYDGE